MDMPLYRWKTGIPTKLSADTFVTHLQGLQDTLKREASPDDLVQDSKHPDSYLHEDFRWGEDAQLAYESRLSHARQLLNGIIVVQVTTEVLNTGPMEKRLLVSYPDPEQPGHRSWGERSIIVSQVDTRSLLLQQLKRDCLSFARNYFEKYGDDLTEVQEINAIVRQLYITVLKDEVGEES